MKSITCNLHVDDSQGNHKYDMILEHNTLSKLNIYLCFSNHAVRVNGNTHKGCTATIKYMTNINANISSVRFHKKTFRNEEF